MDIDKKKFEANPKDSQLKKMLNANLVINICK